jgi:hypothetical protein
MRWGEPWGAHNSVWGYGRDAPNEVSHAMCTPTTPAAMKADFREQIKGISPTHGEYQSAVWSYAFRKADVQGGDLRTFHIQMGPGQSTREGVQSPEAGEFELTMRVWTSYAGLADDDDDSIITLDGTDLWVTLRYRYSVIDGFFSASYEGWEDENTDEGGRRWGAHVFTIRYLQAT